MVHVSMQVVIRVILILTSVATSDGQPRRQSGQDLLRPGLGSPCKAESLTPVPSHVLPS